MDEYLSQLLPRGYIVVLHDTCSSIQEASYTWFQSPSTQLKTWQLPPADLNQQQLPGQSKDDVLLGPMLHHCPDIWPLPVKGKGDTEGGTAVIQAHPALWLQSWSLSFCTVSTNIIWAWSNHCGAICKHKTIICRFLAQTPIDNINFSFATLGTMGTWHPNGVK